MAVAVAAAGVGRGRKRKAEPLDADSGVGHINKRKESIVQSRAEDVECGQHADGDSSPLSVPLIKRHEAEAIASKQRLTHVPALLAHLERELHSSSASSASLHTSTAAYQSLYRILEHYAEAGELPLVSRPNGSSASLAGQLRAWLHSQYERYVACSLSLIAHSHTPLQLSALHALMALVRLSAQSVQPDAATSLLTGGIYPSLVSAVLDSPQYSALHETLTCQYLLAHLDLRLFALRAIKAKCALLARHSDRSTSCSSDTPLHNTLTLLLDLSQPDSADSAPSSSFTNARVSSSALAPSLSGAYMAFLSLSHTPYTYKLILEHLDSHILPNVANPLLLADFLTDSYHIGGIVSLLSLASLFRLMSQHNLDYPHFYHKLYSLCTPALSRSRHRTKLFVLLSKFLSSAYLPSSLVAAFCKRLARLAIVGGCGVDGTVELMRLVWGLLRRNRSVKGLLWGAQEAEKEKEANMESLTDFLLNRQAQLAVDSEKSKQTATESAKGARGADDDIFDDNLSDGDEQEANTNTANAATGPIDPLTVIQSSALSRASAVTATATGTSTPTAATTAAPSPPFSSDPFSPLTDDPAACAASASILWELRSLSHHYAPAVRALAALFYAANAPKGELDAVGVGRVGESEGYEGMIRREIERRKNQKVAVNYRKRATLFEVGDIVSSNFTWA